MYGVPHTSYHKWCLTYRIKITNCNIFYRITKSSIIFFTTDRVAKRGWPTSPSTGDGTRQQQWRRRDEHNNKKKSQSRRSFSFDEFICLIISIWDVINILSLSLRTKMERQKPKTPSLSLFLCVLSCCCKRWAYACHVRLAAKRNLCFALWFAFN